MKDNGGFPEPTFGEALVSVRVLPVMAGSGGASCWPWVAPESPNSLGLAALWGNCWPSASAPASLAAAASPAASGRKPWAGPLTVLRALDFEAALAAEPGLRAPVPDVEPTVRAELAPDVRAEAEPDVGTPGFELGRVFEDAPARTGMPDPRGSTAGDLREEPDADFRLAICLPFRAGYCLY